MEKLLMKYFRNANSYQSIDPTCFNLQEFTETWLEENKEAINVIQCCKSDSELLLFSADEIVSKINNK